MISHQKLPAIAIWANTFEGDDIAGRLSKRTISDLSLWQAKVTRLLQTTLDINEILTIFMGEAAQIFLIRGIKFIAFYEETEFSIGECHSNCHRSWLKAADDDVGELHLFFEKEIKSDMDLVTLKEMTECLIYPIRNALLYSAVVNMALTDPLTGVGNRMNLENHMRKELDTSYRYGDILSVLMVDVDHFKNVNDTCGHAIGDKVLKSVAARIRSELREADLVFRYGGEEFVVVLNKSSIDGACVVAERLRDSISNLELFYDGKNIAVTVSIGVASLWQNETMHELMARADCALYKAKRSGRNRVVASYEKIDVAS